GAMAYAVVGLTQGFPAILATVALAAAVAAPAIPLTDAYGLKGLSLRGRAYGPVRLWGSVAFIAANFGAGLASTYIAPTGYIWLIVATSALAATASLTLRPLRPGGEPERPPPPRAGRPPAMPGVPP